MKSTDFIVLLLLIVQHSLIIFVIFAMSSCGADDSKNSNDSQESDVPPVYMQSDEIEGLVLNCQDGAKTITEESALKVCKCLIGKIAQKYNFNQFVSMEQDIIEEFDENGTKDQCLDKYGEKL